MDLNLFQIQKQFSVYIFYGSEKGFVKSVVDEFEKRLKKETNIINIKVDILNNFFNYIINKGDLIFILVSTTGDGELPENALKFKKLISKNKDFFKEDIIRYSLFAFGDSNYRSFCHAGKIIDRLLKSNGASKFMDTEYHDDAIDENEKIDNWIKKNINYIIDFKDNLFDWFIKAITS